MQDKLSQLVKNRNTSTKVTSTTSEYIFEEGDLPATRLNATLSTGNMLHNDTGKNIILIKWFQGSFIQITIIYTPHRDEIRNKHFKRVFIDTNFLIFKSSVCHTCISILLWFAAGIKKIGNITKTKNVSEYASLIVCATHTTNKLMDKA